MPKTRKPDSKLGLVVLVHGGVHGTFETSGPASHVSIVRELIEQGYAVVAPDYRGSAGYGTAYENALDYGAKENDDVLLARNWMIERYKFLGPNRVAIVGWSHGGMIALINLLLHPEAYACAYAGVPVTDMIGRLGYQNDAYRKTMTDSIGKEARANMLEYRRRSPIDHAGKLTKPLLIHGNTTDETVNVYEVETMIAYLKAAGKNFESKIYESAPGGHPLEKSDTKLARDSRQEIYEFLKRYLKH
ncbi:MAG: alpha/beta fold hydrolase [Acidobacteria bacterium]|nr:alpha/beta fold hydrolase [Acidobacteriota bacterium]